METTTPTNQFTEGANAITIAPDILNPPAEVGAEPGESPPQGAAPLEDAPVAEEQFETEAFTADEAPLVKDKPAPEHYDADAPQNIPTVLEVDGERFKVNLVSGPLRDHQLKEYAKRCTLKADDESEDLAISAQLETSLAAAAWLFDATIADLQGGGVEGEEKPADWKSIFSQQEKSGIINSSLLHCYAVENPAAATGKRFSWQLQHRTMTTRLRCFFDGYELETKHVLKKADAKVLGDFTVTMGRVWSQVSGAGDARMEELAKLYDNLHVSHEGYAGRVPLHHKAAALVAHLSRQNRVLRKN